MRSRRLSILSTPFWVCAVLLIGEITPASTRGTDEESRKAKELTEIQDRIRSTQQSVGGIELQKNSLTEQLAKLEIEYGKLALSMQNLENQSNLAEQEIDKFKKRKAQLTGSVLRQNKALAGQARAAYALGEREWLKVLLSGEDGGGSNRVLTYYRYLNMARMAQLKALDKNLAEARSLENSARSLTQTLEASQETLVRERVRLDELRQLRQQRLTALDRQSRDKTTELSRLREDAQRLQAILANLQKSSPSLPDQIEQTAPTASSRVRSDWPVEGELRQSFGAPRMSGQWDGVVIAAEEGQPVRVSTPGRVAFADWLRGYGLLAILDHGNGLMSLYGFNQSITKSVGDWVNAGEVIASVGSSGGQSEPALYFGLRDKGRPIDPLAWRTRSN